MESLKLALGMAFVLFLAFGPLLLSIVCAVDGNLSGAIFLLLVQILVWAVIQ